MITASPMIPLPSTRIVSIALGVVVGLVDARVEIRSVLQAVVVRGYRSVGVLVKAVDPTGAAEIVGMRVVSLVGVGMFTRRIRFRIADPEVMAVVKRVAVALVRRVVVTMGTVKTAK